MGFSNTEIRCGIVEQRAGLEARKKKQKNRKKPSGSITVHQPSLGICEAVLVSVTHSNAEYHDNRLTDDWSGCHTLVSDLTAVRVSSLCQYFHNPASSSVLCSFATNPVNQQTRVQPFYPAAGRQRSAEDTAHTPHRRPDPSSIPVFPQPLV